MLLEKGIFPEMATGSVKDLHTLHIGGGGGRIGQLIATESSVNKP